LRNLRSRGLGARLACHAVRAIRSACAALPVPATKFLVVTNGDSNKATLVAADTGKVLATLPTGEMPDAAAFEPKSGLVAVVNHKGGSVALIDVKTSSVVATVTLDGELEFAVAAGDGRLFVNVADKAEIAVIDVPAHKLVKSLKMKGCSDPSGLAYDTAVELLMSVCGNGVAKFLHSDGKGVATLRTGMGKSARLGALDPKTGNVYLPAGKLGPPVPPNPWPTVLPGSFEFLVVAKR
jgi:DNA-binding beta-propeller fold protein YncE